MQRTSTLKTLLLCLGIPLGVGMFVGWLIGRNRPHDAPSFESEPVVMRIKKLGDLHTVAMHESEVMHFDTHHEPEGWFANLPGIDSLVRWTTHNSALVVAEGDVEAGVDLSRLHQLDLHTTRRTDGTSVLRIHLPPITIYAPRVTVRVERSQDGLLWRDENIVPKAQQHAGDRFVESAENAGIIARGRANAIDQVRATLQLAGLRNVEPYF